MVAGRWGGGQGDKAAVAVGPSGSEGGIGAEAGGVGMWGELSKGAPRGAEHGRERELSAWRSGLNVTVKYECRATP